MKIELIISIVGGLTAASKWIYEYSNKLKWDKNKFLLEQIENFENKESTKIAETLLDWNGTEITIEGKSFYVDDKLLLDALTTHDLKNKFSTEEFLIRGVFDEYFDNLTRLVILSKTKLISEDNLILFLEYWFEILSGQKENKDKKVLEQIERYLDFYGYNTLLEFILNF